MKKLLAFTLAETLIVIGIIGVVSALTLPNLNSSTGEKEKVAKVKKIYQNLDDAVTRAVAVYGPMSDWRSLDNNTTAQLTRFGNRITEFMKVSKNCGTQANQGCWAKTAAKTVSGSGNFGITDSSTAGYKAILADGTSFVIYDNGGSINFDIDGPNKGANKLGKDVFCLLVNINESSIIPPNNVAVSEILTTGWGEAATNWVILFDNMDYLKADNSGKCPNGKVLDGTTNISCN